MGLGVLEDHRTPMPMGTVVLDEVFGAAQHLDPDDPQFSYLKKDGHVVLQPQPSDSPNDPLNWSDRHKYWLSALLIIAMTTVGATNTMLGTGYKILSERYHTDYPTVIDKLTPPFVGAHAVSLFLASATASVYGKRIQFIGSITVIWLCMLAGYFANSMNYYFGLRIVEGLAAAPMDLLIAPVITDMVYVHKRGRLMALQALVHIIGGDASHIIAGNVITKLGIKYTFIISFGVLFPLVVLVYLFVWETTFTGKRPDMEMSKKLESVRNHHPIDEPEKSSEADTGNKEFKVDEKATTKELDSADTSSRETPSPPPDHMNHMIEQQKEQQMLYAGERKKTFREQLPVFRGRLTGRSWWKSLLLPFPFMLYPAVLFSTIVNGAFLAFLITSMIITMMVLQFPPYNLKPDVLAYVGLPGSAAGLLAAICAGLLNDWTIKKMAKRNNGVYEPEFRLLNMIPATILSTIGFFLIGPAYKNHYSVARIIALGLFFQISAPFASSACLTYIFDTHNTTSTEAFVATALFKSIFILFAVKFVPRWFSQAGPVKVYNTLGALNLCFCLLTIPMYVYGKRLRGIVTRNKRLAKFNNVKNTD